MFHITLILFLQMCNLMKHFYNQILISSLQSIVEVISFHLLMEKGSTAKHEGLLSIFIKDLDC